VNSRFTDGDVVYVYWTALPGYRYYKEAYNLKYTAIEGKDYRYLVNTEDAYFKRLFAEIEQLKGNRRVWLVYHKGYVAKIGDVEGIPEWYYKDDTEFTHLNTLRANFESWGIRTHSFIRPDIDVHLFDFSGAPE
jgi:hypothetical protein